VEAAVGKLGVATITNNATVVNYERKMFMKLSLPSAQNHLKLCELKEF
jgi:hypothetical protein